MMQFRIAVAEAPFNQPDAEQLLHAMGDVLRELSGRSGTGLRFISAAAATATSGLVDAHAGVAPGSGSST